MKNRVIKKLFFCFALFSLFSITLFSQNDNPWKDVKSWSKLMKATNRERYCKMKRLIKNNKKDDFKFPINSVDLAVDNQDTVALKILLNTGWYNYENSGNQIYWACKKNSLSIVRILYEFGFPLKTEPQNNLSPLMIAVQFSSYEVVEYLLNQQKININQQQEPMGYTALIRAVTFGRLDIIKLLLAHGADKTIKTKSGNTALYFMKYIDKTKVSAEDITKIEELLK